MEKEITNMEILEALNSFSTKIDKRFDEFEERFNRKIDDLEVRINQRLDYHETWLNRIERNMVTKNEFNNLIKSVNGLINVLKNKDIISGHDSSRLLYNKLVN